MASLVSLRNYAEPHPITKLPDEILAEIFLQLIRMHDPRGVTILLKDYRPHGWLELGHVCRAWRHLLLDYPVFWSRIILSEVYPERVKLFLERSRKCPIEVEGKHARKETQAFWSITLWRECSRWVRAEVTINRNVVKEFKTPLQMPLLEDLYVTMDDVVDFPPLTHAAIPRLKNLECKSCPWKALRGWFRPTLTCIRVSGLARGNLPSTSDWLDVLRDLPSLRELHLMRGSIAPQAVVSLIDNPGVLVHLPCLETFHVAQYASSVCAATHLLTLISVHPSCCIRLEVMPFYWSVPLDTMKSIIDALASKMSTFRIPFDAFYTGMELQMPQGQWLDVNLGRRAQTNASLNTSAVEYQLHVTIDLSGEEESYVSDLINHIWSSTLISSMTSLTVEELGSNATHTIAPADLRRASGVEVLHIACHATLALFADILEAHLRTPEEEDPFPHLRLLTIDKEKVRPPRDWDRTPLDRVLDALARRENLGLGPHCVLK